VTIERISNDEDFWLTDLAALDTPEARQEAKKGTAEEWATQSLLAAREAYQNPPTGMRIKPGTKLGFDYHNKNLPVVKERMSLAAMRLAKVLNECFE
jgi:hypothetical protein